jgi:uncharacterized protein YbaR (Trm112 family)
MTAGSSPHLPFDAAILAQLACPACLGELHAEESQLICGSCGRIYPIVDGIPVLISGEQEAPSSECFDADSGK